jgi:hypothetical protein
MAVTAGPVQSVRATIALLRVQRPPAELARMDGRQLFAFRVEARLFGSLSTADTTLGRIQVAGDRTTTQSVFQGAPSRFDYEFVRDGQGWRLDIWPALSLAFTRQMAGGGSAVSQDQNIFRMVERLTGQRIDASIFARPVS